MRETVCGGQACAGAQVLERLRAGAAVALVSDAGMPAVSDPGAGLVAAAAAAGARVVPVPGPCAALAALVASGLPTAAFHFAGFLPPKAHARRARPGRPGRCATARPCTSTRVPERLTQALVAGRV